MPGDSEENHEKCQITIGWVRDRADDLPNREPQWKLRWRVIQKHWENYRALWCSGIVFVRYEFRAGCSLSRRRLFVVFLSLSVLMPR